MIQPRFLQALFADTYDDIQRQTQGITHGDSVQQPPFDGNCINWILGHLVVARCNFLMLLEVPSIWSMEQCRRFIPGSAPVTGAEDALPLDALLAGLARTQEQLLTALARVSAEDLQQVKGEQAIGEHLISYHAHEAYHLGQLELLRQLVTEKAST
jgi:hypothetical protein